MRKVSEQTVKAFLNGVKKSVGNTLSTGTELLLHGNKIAWKDEGTIFLSDCDWRTTTTKERLNAILAMITEDAGIFQKKGTWFINQKGSNTVWNGEAKLMEGIVVPL